MPSPGPMTSEASDLGLESLALFLDGDQLSQQVDPKPPHDSASGLRGRKRKHQDSSLEDSSQKVQTQSKKRKPDIQYSCPYRRRNPRLFNVRDFHACANRSFSNMSFVKRHVMTNHQSRDFTSQCLKCKVWFSKQAFDYHSMNQSCSSLPPPVFDEHDKGITQEMETKLRDRRAKTKVLTWEGLWRTIFPDNASIETPDFEPILEHNEAKELFYRELLDPEYSAMGQSRGVVSTSGVLDPAEVVRNADHIVDTAPLQAQAFPFLALEPCMASFQYPSGGPDMGLQSGLSNSRVPEHHLSDSVPLHFYAYARGRPEPEKWDQGPAEPAPATPPPHQELELPFDKGGPPNFLARGFIRASPPSSPHNQAH